MKRILIIILLLISNLTFSQLSNKHWLPPLHANEDTVSDLIKQHYVYLSTPEAIPFAVTVTNGAGVQISGSPFTISQGAPVTIFVGSAQPSVMFLDRNEVGAVKSGKGLILEGLNDFYVSFRVLASSHAEFLSSKGRTGAGTVFRLGSLPQNDQGDNIRNFVSSFMATEDNTSVSLSDYNPSIKFIINGADVSTPNQNFTLNKGQSVVVSGNTEEFANFTGFVGALLTSDKPIVVNTGNLAGGMSGNGQDFNLDQIVPLDQVGDEYVIMKGNGSSVNELPLVIAHEDNTEIYVNGSTTPIATLNGGDYFLIPTSNFVGSAGNQNMYIRSGNAKPFFLYQIVAGDQNDYTSGFYFIPPLNCFWQKSVDLIPSINEIGSTTFTSSIIIATETGSTISINNVPTTVLPVPVTGNLNWVSYRINNLTGDVKVESTGALAVGVFGASGAAGIGGYFSGFGSLPKDSQTTICSNSIVDLFDRIPGNPEVGGVWSYNGIDRMPNNGIFDPVSDPIGVYLYTFTKTCNGISRPYPISIEVLPIQVGPNAGASSTQNYCTYDTSVNLFSLLGSSVSTTGNWTLPNGTIVSGNTYTLDPATGTSGNYIYTIDASGVCDAVSATIAVVINPAPQLANTITDLEECDDSVDGDTSGISLFTLTNKNNQITNSTAGLSVKYYENQIDANNNAANNITSIRAASGKIIYFRLSDANCFIVSSFNLIVNALPVTLAEVFLKQCDDDTDAITDFNLTEANTVISSDNTLIYSYHPSQSGAINNTNLIANELNHNAANGSVVWARVETSKGCFRTTKVNLVVSTTQIPASFNPAALEECDDYVDASNLANDGFDNFNIDLEFTQQIKDVFPVGQRPFLTISYFESYNDALLVQNRIIDPTNYRNINASSQPIWARVDSSLNTDTGCKGITELRLIVNPLPEFDLGLNFVLCVDPVTGIGSKIVDATPDITGNYSYTWVPTNPDTTLGNENAQFDITQAGTYSVTVTNNTTGCQNFDTIVADFSSEPADFYAEVTTPAFSSGLATIVCTATGGFGEYEYSLDNTVDWQNSPIFTDVSNGSHIVYVRDIQGCAIKSYNDLLVLTYPNFFTPNGDGYHDSWNIEGFPFSYEAKIYIFDRYGKLLKEVGPYGEGWNGTFNGKLLPSTDYWFKVEYIENGVSKVFKSHFSLIR